MPTIEEMIPLEGMYTYVCCRTEGTGDITYIMPTGRRIRVPEIQKVSIFLYKEGSMNENQEEMGEMVMQRFTDGKRSGSDNKDIGAVCETPRVIELGNVSERYCCCNGDNE